MKKLTAAAALLSLGILPVFAQGATSDNLGGPYVGGGFGQFSLDINNLNDAGTATRTIANSEDNAWKIFAGWRLMQFLAIEAAYIDFGQPSDRFTATGSNGNYRVELAGFAPSIIGSLPLGPIELSVKVGYYFYDAKVKVDFDNPGPDVDSTHSRSDFLYGAGLGFTFAEHIHLALEYETVEIENASSSDAFWLTGAWRF